MSKKASSKKTASKTRKTGEALAKDAIATIDRNIERIEAVERGKKPAARTAPTTASAKPRGAARKAAKASTAKKPPKEKRLNGLDLAAHVLSESKEPLSAKVITDRVIAAGWKTNGATPQATLYAAMIREIAAKGKDARFKKVDRGMFTANK